LDRTRCDVAAFRFAFAPTESCDGGTDEFDESLSNRARSAATSASNAAIRASACTNRSLTATTSAANSSYDGCSTVDTRS
jgi:hypothetical protein